MAGFDGAEFGKNIVDAVNASIERSLAPLIARLSVLETAHNDYVAAQDTSSRGFTQKFVAAEKRMEEFVTPDRMDEALKDIRAGLESVMMPEMQEALSVMVKEAVAGIPTARDGKDADPVDLDALADRVRGMIVVPEPLPVPELPDIAGMIDAAVKAVPVPVAPELPDIAALVSKAVSEIPIPVTPELPDIAAMVAAIPVPTVDMDEVKRLIDEAVKTIPAPADGKDGRDGVDGSSGQDGRDGAYVTAAMIDRDGHLHLTLSNGEQKNVGQVVGDDGVDCDIQRIDERIAGDIKALWDAHPKPKDGLGFDDLSVEYDGERTFKFVMARGDQRKEFAFDVPMVIDRGIYSDGKSYARGDAVTWDGSSWIAQTDGAKEKPGTGKEWRLAIKRGKAGKDGVMTVPRPNVPVKLGDR